MGPDPSLADVLLEVIRLTIVGYLDFDVGKPILSRHLPRLHLFCRALLQLEQPEFLRFLCDLQSGLCFW